MRKSVEQIKPSTSLSWMVHSLDHAGFGQTWRPMLHWMAPGERPLLRGILLHHHLRQGRPEEKAAVGCSPMELVRMLWECCPTRRTPPLLRGQLYFPSTVVCFYVMDTECPPTSAGEHSIHRHPVAVVKNSLWSVHCHHPWFHLCYLPHALFSFCSSLFYKQSFAFYTLSLNHFWEKNGGKESYFFLSLTSFLLSVETQKLN